MTLECAKQKLQQYGQEHLLKYFDTLSETQKEALLQQIEETDFSVLNKIGLPSLQLKVLKAKAKSHFLLMKLWMAVQWN